MAYKHTNSKGITYYLHKTDVTLRGGTKTRHKNQQARRIAGTNNRR
jgi:hypothetical protein